MSGPEIAVTLSEGSDRVCVFRDGGATTVERREIGGPRRAEYAHGKRAAAPVRGGFPVREREAPSL